MEQNNSKRWAVIVDYRSGYSVTHWDDYRTEGCAHRDAQELRELLNPEVAFVHVECWNREE